MNAYSIGHEELHNFQYLMLLLTFQGLLSILTEVFSKSFSIGEVLVVSQGISFLLWSGNQNIIQLLSFNNSSSYEEMSHLQVEEMNKGTYSSVTTTHQQEY